jgi:hypothetical protein
MAPDKTLRITKTLTGAKHYQSIETIFVAYLCNKGALIKSC